LREDLIDQTAKVVRTLNPIPRTVILFGSLARGMRDFRDVDLLCVVAKGNEKIVVHDRIAETFEKVRRRYKVPVSAVVATEAELRSPSLTSVVTEARRDGILLAGTAPTVLQGVRVWSHAHPHAA
ncbi:MAG TPA: nucleotidyltransferase domain-containing protein, partial [Gemmatimonadaceae bacterium]|nr:nucleotidyltransferase domain-containing protein [Gemmatimonadaceae bacterium]